MRAFSIVSLVVKVLEMTTMSVVSGSRPMSDLDTSIGSTLARKRSERPRDTFIALGSVLAAVGVWV